MEAFIPLLILAAVVVVLVYKNSAHAKAVIDAHADTLKSVVSSLAAKPVAAASAAAPVLEIPSAVLQHPAVVQGLVTPATAAVLSTAALDFIAGTVGHAANAAYAAAQTPQAAGYRVISFSGTPPAPAVFQAMDATTVAEQGDGFYVDNTGAVCHFEHGVKVMGYAAQAAHA